MTSPLPQQGLILLKLLDYLETSIDCPKKIPANYRSTYNKDYNVKWTKNDLVQQNIAETHT